MAKNISLTDLVINTMMLDFIGQCVKVEYSLVDASGKAWISGEAFFWLNMPSLPPNHAIPDNWFQLPASYVPTLIGLRNDADTALTNKFLV